MSDRPSPPRISRLEQLFIKCSLLIPLEMMTIVVGFLSAISVTSIVGKYLPFFQSRPGSNILILVTFILVFFLVMFWSSYINVACSLLQQCSPQPIPSGKFPTTLRLIDQEAEKIRALNFDLIDQFYLKRARTIVLYYFKHRDENIYWILVRVAGQFTYSELFSQLNSQLLLATTTAKKGGNFPRPADFYIQVFPNVSYDSLLNRHERALAIFAEQGYYSTEIPETEIRSFFMQTERAASRHIMRHAFWAVQATFWTLLNRGKKYQESIEDQLRAGMIAIPDRFS
jgi:hypothetical protein